MVTRIDAETELTRQTRYQDFEPFAFRFKSKELVRRRNGESCCVKYKNREHVRSLALADVLWAMQVKYQSDLFFGRRNIYLHLRKHRIKIYVHDNLSHEESVPLGHCALKILLYAYNVFCDSYGRAAEEQRAV